MAIEIKAPAFPESVADGEVAAWHKQEGEAVSRDELIVEIETDKVVMEVVAPEDGVLAKMHVQEGDTIASEQLLATLEQGVAVATPAAEDSTAEVPAIDAAAQEDVAALLGPAARQLVEEHQLDIGKIAGTGKNGRITKEDILKHMKDTASAAPVTAAPVPEPAAVPDVPLAPTGERVEKRVPMTRMRAKIAERLLNATQETAMLTTFNEVNMAPMMALRSKYREKFEKAHNGTRLGFMGMFVKAACEALKRYPEVNASIDGNDVVYHGYQDIGVAVSTEGGLVVPVLRDADFMSVADVEAAIRDMGLRARDNKLTIEDMTGGTFTVTNGGVFGSLMSTPILNPPQTGILGMHKIQERPMAVNGEVVILPMMYLALSYDHRLVDGKSAVQFLVAVKDLIEDPARILLQL
ncbi:2-oxoglutarate dehydrogenase complex dihydrolipoyllysine-residue succinyltransferase [Halieaceae bacterium IMCC8485]|jgi:2-oxoglutarate dehydrogenase E2 component (dihydrolipoamide succinyltransferase)|uniref:Dihydrolipoyllysine-residue succinyltransferase component of 2-oxoglutarate dehydrogenase complex n=1 Tax=Candidatus Seongchinamella marina TaxID=2518990 RepID=A0ABT3SUI0_9GAMM|nr:2-oxoglutarate dehydrogenase complex dihydrolipoyllysine-residue succinyltransferase [Candidatus Seongchinamella marina]MCX2973310.1 2-oxoglutarate dehydrogenase complex dihydrolipoyllysine-residue succinyltransferase [Candidatus Seongchinamella marina]